MEKKKTPLGHVSLFSNIFIKEITSIITASVDYYNKLSAYFFIGSISGSGKLLKNIIDTVTQNKENKLQHTIKLVSIHVDLFFHPVLDDCFQLYRKVFVRRPKC